MRSKRNCINSQQVSAINSSRCLDTFFANFGYFYQIQKVSQPDRYNGKKKHRGGQVIQCCANVTSICYFGGNKFTARFSLSLIVLTLTKNQFFLLYDEIYELQLCNLIMIEINTFGFVLINEQIGYRYYTFIEAVFLI